MSSNKKTGIMLLIIGIIITILASQIPNPNLENDVGPRLFPYISGIGLIICGIGLMLEKTAEKAKVYLTPEGWKRLCIMSGVILLYAIGLVTLGFLIATPIAVFASIIVMNGNMKIYKTAIIFSLCITGSVYLIFEKVLLVMLPSGKLF